MSSRRGRPPLDPNDRSVDVHFRLPGRQYDQLEERARRERLTTGDLIRRELRIDPRPNFPRQK